MPHIVLGGGRNLWLFWRGFGDTSTRLGDRVFSASAAFASPDGRRVLLDCTVVEGYLRQTFLVEVVARDQGLLVHLFHATRPERSEGVRLCLAWIASLLRAGPSPPRWVTDNLGLGEHPFRQDC